MEAQTTGNKMHPVLWVAAISVILLSAAGIGAIFGVIPTASSTSKPAEPIVAAVPAAAPAAAPAPAATAEPSHETAKPAAKPAPKHKVVAKAPEAAPAPAQPAAAPVAAQPAPPPAPAICVNCGTVDSIREYEQKGEGTGLGAVGGAVAGGLIGSQIGRGSGRTAATVIGAVGGGYAGHQVEKHVRSTKKYEMTVRFEDGNTRVFHYDSPPAWRIGDRVKLDNGVLVTR